MLNRAREANPTEYKIYIAAAKLEEAQGNLALIPKILKKAVDNMGKHKVQLKRDQWLQQAVIAEQSDSILTCKGIVKQTMHVGLEIDSYADEKEQNKQRR